MSLRRQSSLFWPIVAGVLGVAALVAVVLRFVRLPAPHPAGQAEIKPAAIVISQEQASNEISLFSQVPLFMPTAVNASRLELPAEIQQEPTAIFHTFEPKYTFSIDRPAITFPEPFSDRFQMPATPAAAPLIGETPNIFEGMGRVDRLDVALPARLGYLTVSDAKTGRTVLQTALSTSEGRLPPKSWQPFQLIAEVDVGGLVEEPMVWTSSGSEEIDAFFRTFLARTFRIGKRLEPGFYRLGVGP
jgi:hypothetical protein